MFRLLAISYLLTCSLASSQCNLNPSSYSFSVGRLNITSISDGFVSLPRTNFDVPSASLERASRFAFQPIGERITNSLNVYVVDTPSNRILLDAGGFNTPEVIETGMLVGAGLAPANLNRAGIDPGSIDTVLLSHGHPDHIGSLTQPDGSLTYPNATVYIPRIDHEFWTALSESDTGILRLIRLVYLRNIPAYERVGRLRLVEFNDQPVNGVTFLASPGHSPGHASILLRSQGRKMLYSGDAFRTRWDQTQHPDWRLAVDTNPDQGIESRLALLEEFADREDVLIATAHENFLGVGHVVKSGPFFDWRSADYQLIGDVERVCSGM